MAATRGDPRQHMLRLQMSHGDVPPPLFSPALPSALHHHHHHQFRQHSIAAGMPGFPPQLQQQPFFPQPPPHIPHRGSIIGLPPGTLPIPAMPLGPSPAPMTPVSCGPPLGMPPPHHLGMGHNARQGSISLPFTRNRRQPSISTGGPPKATLGGPQNKHVAPPITNPATASAALEAKLKGKKLTVKLPREKETVGDDGNFFVPLWTRYPIPHEEVEKFPSAGPPEMTSAELWPEPLPQGSIPPSIDVFLPGKGAWEDVRIAFIEEKLEKLGVEPALPRGPLPLGIHGRAASISSPADPQLLFFKLNKLHQQGTSPTPGLSLSPQPPALSPSPGLGPRLPGLAQQTRHGHSLSLSNPPASFVPPVYNPAGSFNPFGPSATLGSDTITRRSSISDTSGPAETEVLHQPRGIVPNRPSAILTRPDFIRGFGLDIAEETEEEMEEAEREVTDAASAPEVEPDREQIDQGANSEPDDRTASGLGSRKHSRHTSRVSIALSLRSLGRGGRSESGIVEEEDKTIPEDSVRPWGSEGGDLQNSRLEEGDAATEWTGSESVQDQVHEGDDEQSLISEYSNPSDEERARLARLERRRQLLNNLHTTEGVPRRLPNFPRPPESIQRIKPRASEESMISNPSEEERLLAQRLQQRLGSTPRRASSPFGSAGRPLPPIPSHSRTASGQRVQLSPHHVPLPHSRQQSGHMHSLSGSGGPTPTGTRRESLNPNAKPFVFSKQWTPNTSSPPIASAPVPAPAASSSVKLNAAAPEFKPSLNPSAAEFKPSGALTAAAPEFKPSVFAFRPPQDAPHINFPEPLPFVALHYSTQAPAESLSALDDPPINAYGRAYQGREKRARRGSSASIELPLVVDVPIAEKTPADADPRGVAGTPPVGADGETWNNLAAFKFPPSHKDNVSAPETDKPQHGSLPPPPRSVLNPTLNATARPFFFPSAPSQSTTSPVLPPKTEEVTTATTTTPVVVEGSANGGSIAVHVEETESEAKGTRPLPIPPSPAPRKPVPLNELPLRKGPDDEGTSTHDRPLPHRSSTLLPDFRPHPVSTNTVPAGLFKKLANGEDDGPVRPTVRSRLSSREMFEHNHRPSLDDIHMPAISRKGAVGGEDKESRWEGGLGDDLFAGIEARGLSSALLRFRKLPRSETHSAANSMSSFSSELRKQSQLERMEQRVDELLEEKMDALRRDLKEVVEEQLAGISSAFNRSTSQTLAHLRNTRNVGDDSRVDGMGEIDVELIRNIVEDSNKEVQASVQRDLTQISSQNLQSTRDEMLRMVEEQASRVVNALHGATMNMCARIDAVDHLVREPITGNVEDILREFMLDLEPHLVNVRTPQLDVDAITARLSEAVRPSLAQLIDFASDKRETAALIVEQLAPQLASLKRTGPLSQLDTQAVASQLAADVSRLVPPVDSHALTEQVADLVVERLNARLENRDKMLRPDVLAGHVVAEINPMLPSLGPVHEALNRITIEQSNAATAQQLDGLFSGQHALSKAVERLPELIRDVQPRFGATQSGVSSQVDSEALSAVLAEIQKLAIAQSELKSQNAALADGQQHLTSELQNLPVEFVTKADTLKASQDNLAEVVQQTQNIVDNSYNDFFHTHENLTAQMQVLLGHRDDIVKQIKSLPEALAPSTKAFEAQQADFLDKIRSLPDISELQHARSDLQQQLLKARNSHGQVRSEKDHLQEKVTLIEEDRGRLRAEVQLLKSTAGERETEYAASAARVSALESNLQDALARVSTAEAVNQTLRQQITSLESNQRELQKIGNERLAKINSLELQLQFAKRDVETSTEAQARLEKERDAALDQQQHGGAEIQLMSQKLEALMGLITTRDNDELKTLRRERDRIVALEHEATTAKRRNAELESKVNALERAEAASKKSLEYAQQQVQDAEDTARRLADDLARLDEADKARDAELVQLRAKVDSQSAAKHDLTLRNEALEDELINLRAELKDRATAKWQRDQAKVPNHTQATPRIRPTALTNGKHDSSGDPSCASSPSHGGVWDSMHAPKVGRPAGLPTGPSSASVSRTSYTKPRTNHVGYRRPPSPAQSVVSQAPTLREDGWWE